MTRPRLAKEAHYAYKYRLVIMQGERRHLNGQLSIDGWDTEPFNITDYPLRPPGLRPNAAHLTSELLESKALGESEGDIHGLF